MHILKKGKRSDGRTRGIRGTFESRDKNAPLLLTRILITFVGTGSWVIGRSVVLESKVSSRFTCEDGSVQRLY